MVVKKIVSMCGKYAHVNSQHSAEADSIGFIFLIVTAEDTELQ